MRSQTLRPLARPGPGLQRAILPQHRFININATPASSTPSSNTINIPDPSSSQPAPDAQFEVLGSPFSLLSASVSASQPLYTRKGTLVGFTGKAENAVSTLSLLSPFRRALTGIPFLYQRISSTTPFTALLSTRTPNTTFTVLHLDGRTDYLLTRSSLLAWTGHSLALKPQTQTRLSLSHWGHTLATGRGLLCLSGHGAVYQLALRKGEEYTVHPSNVVAYSVTSSPPQPYRFRSSSLRFQIPSPASWFPDSRFLATVRDSGAWRFLTGLARSLRTIVRRGVWGDRLFLRFEGPATILVQSRARRVADVLSDREVDELASVPAGAVQKALTTGEVGKLEQKPVLTPVTKSSFASVGTDGRVSFEKNV